jgi:eukaryotic-like serine/threonine-protein kinase
MTDRTPDHGTWAADFRVGDWLVEPSLDRLSRNGTTVHLRPQLTNLLVLLARNAGRTVSKDEILSKVWDGQYVAESGMTRCIAEIRQALGDDARDPKIVQTITKRGYRLVAPVTVIQPALPPALSPAVESADSVATAEAPQPTVRAPDAAASPRAPLPAASLPSASFRGVAQLRWRRLPLSRRSAVRRLGLAIAAVVLAGLALAAWAWTRTPAISERDTVLLADVINATGDSAFDQTLRLALAVHLGQAPFLRIVPASQMRAVLALMGRSSDQPVTGPVALEVCRREGAAVLIAGSVAKIGSRFAVGLEALACDTGESVARQLLEVQSKDDVLSAFGTAAGRLRKTLGESRASLNRYSVPIARATTPSLDALRLLSLGDDARDRGQLDDALMCYRRATDVDPLFAVAWARRAAAAHNVAQLAGDERSGVTDEVTLSFKKAYDLRDRVTEFERFYILGHYYRFIAGDVDKAFENYDLWKRIYPGSVVPPTNVASLYVNVLGQYDAGIPPAREALTIAPSSTIAYNTLIAACLGANRIADAKLALRAVERAGAANLSTHRMAFDLAFFENDPAAMQEQIAWASRDAAATISMAQHRADAAASKGRWREARRLWAEADQAAAATGVPAKRAWLLLRHAEAEAILGDAAAARSEAARALTLDHQDATVLGGALVFALAGDPVRSGRLLDEVARRETTDTPLGYVWHPVANAATLAATGRPDDALRAIEPVARFERGRNFGLAPPGTRARILLSAGRPREAATAFRDMLTLRAAFASSPWTTYARLGLARALRSAGDVAGSRAAYDEFIAWTRDGDYDAPVLSAARRERAALDTAAAR